MIVNTNGLAPEFLRRDGAAARARPRLHRSRRRHRAEGRRRQPGVRAQVFRRRKPRRPQHRHRAGRQRDRSRSSASPRDAKYTELRGDTPPTVYFPALQRARRRRELRGAPRGAGARPDGDGRLFPAIRAAVREIDPALPVLNLRTQDEQIDRLHAQELLFARLSGLFGVAGAHAGLRRAVRPDVLRRAAAHGRNRPPHGARRPPAHVLRMILRESLALVLPGRRVGVAAAYGASRLVATMLFGLSPADPLTYGAVALALAPSRSWPRCCRPAARAAWIR